MSGLEGKAAIVTGGATGIGAGMVAVLREPVAAKVFLVDTPEARTPLGPLDEHARCGGAA